MRKCIVFLLVLALVLFPGCGKKAPADQGPLTLNPDGTLGNLRWGMRWAEAAAADSRFSIGTGENPNRNSFEVEFLGKRWTLTLSIGASAYMAGYVRDGVSRLGRLELSPLEEGSWEELVEPLEAVLGPQNITARYVDPKWDEAGNFICLYREPLPEWAWAWASAETLGDRLTDRELAVSYPYSTDLSSLRYGTPLFTVYFQYRDAQRYSVYSYQNVQKTHIPASAETELPTVILEGEYAVEAEILAQLLRSGETERPTLSPGADLDSARLSYEGEDYYFTGEILYELPGGDYWRDSAVLVGAVKPKGSREELTGNLDGYVYMQRDLLFPLYFRWRDWDEAEGPEPYLVFSIRKGGL